MDISLLHRPFLGRGSRSARHAVGNDIMVDTLEIRRTIPVIIRHDLLQHKIRVADHILIQIVSNAKFFFQIRGCREHFTLSVAAHASPEGDIQNLHPGFCGFRQSRREQTVRKMPVIMQNKLRPTLTKRSDKFTHKQRRTVARHIFQTQNNGFCRLFFTHAENTGNHRQSVFRHVKVMFNVKTAIGRYGKSRFENNVLTA